MKKLLPLLIVLTAIGTLAAHPASEQPEAAVPLSDERYAELTRRLAALDSTLTAAECAELYYGFATRPEYTGSKGYGEDGVQQLIGREKYRKAYKQAVKVLEKCPVSLEAHYLMLFIIFKLGMSREQAFPYAFHLEKLMLGIFTSGNGTNKEQAIRVLAVRDEYVLMQLFFDVRHVREQTLEDERYDVMTVDTPVLPGKTIYFDVSLPLNRLRKDVERIFK